MEIVSIDGISITIKDSVKIEGKSGSMYITDAEVSLEQFNDFVSLYKRYNSKGKYFNSIIDKKGFYGRFGQIVYSEGEPNYKLRLVFVESKLDIEDNLSTPSYVFDRAEYQNMIDKIVRQDLIIEKLVSILVEKEIIHESEANILKNLPDEDVKGIKFKMATQVSDLDEYLNSINDRLVDIREQEGI